MVGCVCVCVCVCVCACACVLGLAAANLCAAVSLRGVQAIVVFTENGVSVQGVGGGGGEREREREREMCVEGGGDDSNELTCVQPLVYVVCDLTGSKLPAVQRGTRLRGRGGGCRDFVHHLSLYGRESERLLGGGGGVKR